MMVNDELLISNGRTDFFDKSMPAPFVKNDEISNVKTLRPEDEGPEFSDS